MIENHPEVKFGKTGVLIINLGTPDSTSWLDIRKYLKEFLSDRRVIEVNPILWKIILNIFILNLRPSKTAKAYKEIWMKNENISPLLYYTKKQAQKVSNPLADVKLAIPVTFNSCVVVPPTISNLASTGDEVPIPTPVLFCE